MRKQKEEEEEEEEARLKSSVVMLFITKTKTVKNNTIFYSIQHKKTVFMNTTRVVGRYITLSRRLRSRHRLQSSSSMTSQGGISSDHRAEYILEFWLGESWKSASTWDPLSTTENSQKWFGKSEELDTTIRQEFGQDVDLLETTYKMSWNKMYNADASLEECLAYIILGDQMCRNMYRGSKDMYRADALTLPLSKHLVANGHLRSMSLPMMFFTLLPLMHSEDVEDQKECVRVFQELLQEAQQDNHEAAESFLTQVVSYAKSHEDVVATYGRFPHRNGILGRSNTPEEEQGFAQGTIPSF